MTRVCSGAVFAARVPLLTVLRWHTQWSVEAGHLARILRPPTNQCGALVCERTYRMQRLVILTQFFCCLVVGLGEGLEPSRVFPSFSI